MDSSANAEALAAKLGEQLLTRKLTVTAAESCTGGGVAYAITSVAGSSQWFRCGLVTYSNAAKQHYLGVEAETLRRDGAVSEAVVLQMVAGALAAADADLAVAISGIAGPDGGTPDKPVGTVWFAWADRQGRRVSEHVVFSGDRMVVRERSVVKALAGLLALLEQSSTKKPV